MQPCLHNLCTQTHWTGECMENGARFMTQAQIVFALNERRRRSYSYPAQPVFNVYHWNLCDNFDTTIKRRRWKWKLQSAKWMEFSTTIEFAEHNRWIETRPSIWCHIQNIFVLLKIQNQIFSKWICSIELMLRPNCVHRIQIYSPLHPDYQRHSPAEQNQ